MAIAVALAIMAAGITAHALDASILVGHWRKTTIGYTGPIDTHLVLSADGSVERWVVTTYSRSGWTSGTWNVEGNILTLLLNKEVSLPFTIHNGQLVFPNIQNRRGYWEKIGR